MAEFREYRKTATVEAIQVTEDDWKALAEAHPAVGVYAPPVGGVELTVEVQTEEGPIRAPLKEEPYLCRGVQDEMWLVKADIFEASYEPLEEGGS